MTRHVLLAAGIAAVAERGAFLLVEGAAYSASRVIARTILALVVFSYAILALSVPRGTR